MLGTHPQLSLSWAHADCLIRPAINCLLGILQDVDDFKDTKDFSVRQLCVHIPTEYMYIHMYNVHVPTEYIHVHVYTGI